VKILNLLLIQFEMDGNEMTCAQSSTL